MVKGTEMSISQHAQSQLDDNFDMSPKLDPDAMESEILQMLAALNQEVLLEIERPDDKRNHDSIEQPVDEPQSLWSTLRTIGERLGRVAVNAMS